MIATLLYQQSDLRFTSTAVLPELEPLDPDQSPAPPEVAVVWGPASAPVERPRFSRWTTPSGGEWLVFSETPDGFAFTFPAHGEFLVSRDVTNVEVRMWAGTPDRTARHLLLFQVLPLIMSRRGRFVLHAAAVSFGDEVVAFLGRSGAGKSTLAAQCAMMGASVVCDDCLVLYRRGATWLAVPGDAGVRLWPAALGLLGWHADSGAGLAHYTKKRRVDAAHPALSFETRTLPLSRIIVLPTPDRDPVPARELRGRDAVIAIASEVFRVDPRDSKESREQFDAIAALATEVPIEAMGPLRPPDAWAETVLCRMKPAPKVRTS
jgi:hypothetical protein